MTKTASTGFALVLLCASIGSANASGWYFGGSFGPSNVDVNGYDDASSFRIFFGADASDYLAMEVGAVSLGKFDVTGYDANVDVTGVDLSVLGKLPVSDSFSFYGKVGMFTWNVDANVSGYYFGNDTGTGATYGLGGDFKFGSNLRGRVAWDYYDDVSGGNIDVYSFGLMYAF